MSKELNTKNKFFKSFTPKSLTWFIISLVLIAFGLIFTVLGLIDDYTNLYNSPLETPNESMKAMMAGVGFTWFGVIVTVAGAIILAFALSFASKSEDREKDREARRRQRRESLSTQTQNQETYSTLINNSQETKKE